jgi:hypothetical protein
MNKMLSLLLVLAIAIAAIPYARGLGTPEAPPGIAADHWIPMGEAGGTLTAVPSLPRRMLHIGNRRPCRFRESDDFRKIFPVNFLADGLR